MCMMNVRIFLREVVGDFFRVLSISWYKFNKAKTRYSHGDNINALIKKVWKVFEKIMLFCILRTWEKKCVEHF